MERKPIDLLSIVIDKTYLRKQDLIYEGIPYPLIRTCYLHRTYKSFHLFYLQKKIFFNEIIIDKSNVIIFIGL